jgi:hypothetical protein
VSVVASTPDLRDNVERARTKYLPADGIKILFIAEAPPADPTRFFYFEHVRSHDWLYLGIMRAVYRDARELAASDLRHRKGLFLQRFQADGCYLIDACIDPMPVGVTPVTKRRLIEASLSRLVDRVRSLVRDGTPVVLISSSVHGVCYEPLCSAGIKVINSTMIDFPSSGRQTAFQQKIDKTLEAFRPASENTPWSKTEDGSILNEKGNVVYFSCRRFVESICLGNHCFICGASPNDKSFNDEHIFPEWLLRAFSLFDRYVTLPNGSRFKYAQYKIPCCADCNSDMGRRIEEPVRDLFHRGHDAVADHFTKEGCLILIVWMALIFLKTHLRDRHFNMTLDRRITQEPISSLYKWESLHHIHTLARCFVTGAEIQHGVLGTCFVLPAKVESGPEAFDVGDLYEAQVALVRCHNVAILTVFNDSTAVTGHLLRRLKKVTGPLSTLQLREIMVEAACCNLHLKERPQYASLIDLQARTSKLIATLPQSPGFRPIDLIVRGKLMERALRPTLSPSSIVGYQNVEDFWAQVREGRYTFLYDDDGNFVSEQYVPL